MPDRADTTRASSSGSTTTAMVALLAMAASCSAVVMPRSVHAPVESRAILIEGQSVREVAAAVAAIARDLFGADQADAAVPELAWTDQYLPTIEHTASIERDNRIAHVPPLIEQEFDLPPPAC